MVSAERKKKLEANIWKFYIYRILSSLAFTIPIFVLFYQENGLSMTEIMILQSVYTLIIMIFVVPSGIVADYIGRKKVLIAEAFLFSLGWAIFAMGNGFWQFFVAEVIVAVSSAMWLASGTSFLYDTLRELKKEHTYKKRYGMITGMNYVFYGLASFAGGYIAVHGLRLNFWMYSAVTALAFLVTFWFTDPKNYKHADTHYLEHLKGAAKFASEHKKVRMLIIYSAVYLSIAFSAYMLFQPYFISIELPIVYFGFAYLVMNVLAAIGAYYGHKIDNIFGEKKVMFLILISSAVAMFGMSKITAFIGIVFPIIHYFSWGIFEPIISDYMNKHIESHHRATVIGLNSLVIEAASSVISPFFGWIVDAWSLQTAFILAGAMLCVNAAILAIIFKRRNYSS